jgi:hypothetical protein
MIQAEQLCLKVDSPIITPEAHNSRPPCWPPPPDFPVVVDGSGRIVSRYSDPIWNVSCWAGRPTLINFGDGRKP